MKIGDEKESDKKRGGSGRKIRSKKYRRKSKTQKETRKEKKTRKKKKMMKKTRKQRKKERKRGQKKQITSVSPNDFSRHFLRFSDLFLFSLFFLFFFFFPLILEPVWREKKRACVFLPCPAFESDLYPPFLSLFFLSFLLCFLFSSFCRIFNSPKIFQDQHD